MPFIDIDDARLHYRLDGPESGPVIVLVNSIATDMRVWDDVAVNLTDTFRILRYDARGQGQSSVAGGSYSLALLVKDLLALLDRLQLEKVHLCGLSLGAMVGMRLATDYPQRIGKLVLCNTAARVGPPESWDARAAAVADNGMEAIRQAVLGRWLSASFVENDKAGVDRILKMSLESPAAGYIGSCAAIRDMDQRESIRSIAAPTMVISGNDDIATTPEDARYIADAIPGAIHVALSGGHLSNVEQPARLSSEIRQFLLA